MRQHQKHQHEYIAWKIDINLRRQRQLFPTSNKLNQNVHFGWIALSKCQWIISAMFFFFVFRSFRKCYYAFALKKYSEHISYVMRFIGQINMKLDDGKKMIEIGCIICVCSDVKEHKRLFCDVKTFSDVTKATARKEK